MGAGMKRRGVECECGVGGENGVLGSDYNGGYLTQNPRRGGGVPPPILPPPRNADHFCGEAGVAGTPSNQKGFQHLSASFRTTHLFLLPVHSPRRRESIRPSASQKLARTFSLRVTPA